MAALLFELFQEQLNRLVRSVLRFEFGRGAGDIGPQFASSSLEFVPGLFKMLALRVELLLAASEIGLPSANVVDQLSGLRGEQRVGSIGGGISVDCAIAAHRKPRGLVAQVVGRIVEFGDRIETGVLGANWVRRVKAAHAKASGRAFSAARFTFVASELIASHRA